MKKGFALVVLSLALSGCVNFGEKADSPAVVYYVLGDPTPPATAKPAAFTTPTS
jgi:hypothetical protein